MERCAATLASREQSRKACDAETPIAHRPRCSMSTSDNSGTSWATVQPVPNEATFQLFAATKWGSSSSTCTRRIRRVRYSRSRHCGKTEEERSRREAKANETPPPTWEVQTRKVDGTYKAGSEQERIEADYAKGAETSWVDGENFVSYTLNFKTMLETKDKSNDPPRKFRRNDHGWAARDGRGACGGKRRRPVCAEDAHGLR